MWIKTEALRDVLEERSGRKLFDSPCAILEDSAIDHSSGEIESPSLSSALEINGERAKIALAFSTVLRVSSFLRRSARISSGLLPGGIRISSTVIIKYSYYEIQLAALISEDSELKLKILLFIADAPIGPISSTGSSLPWASDILVSQPLLRSPLPIQGTAAQAGCV